MQDYKPNSHKSKEKRVGGKVVTGVAKTKKKNDVQKLANIFISEDVANVKSYILMDVLVPAIKKAISDIVTNGIDMVLYGGSGRGKRGGNSASKISYRNYYERESDRHRDSSRSRPGLDYDEIVFETRGDAEAVLSEMSNVIEQFGFVSVGDLYDLADISTTNYAVNKYGWKALGSAQVVRGRSGGYMIKLPRASQLD